MEDPFGATPAATPKMADDICLEDPPVESADGSTPAEMAPPDPEAALQLQTTRHNRLSSTNTAGGDEQDEEWCVPSIH